MNNETVEARLNPNSHLKIVKPHETADDYDTIRHGSGNGGGGDMLDRVKKLEDQMTSLVTDVAIIKSNYATKADLHEEIGKQTKWIALTIIGTVSVAMAVAKILF
ncbi:hypothetical protein [Pantoea agglomerans]|uniref:hypothetical protein n=1 Tax=Enterobacter agglomerans TaxID=549 RepID=UPI001FCF14D7|nr:hypothetical protein [Pantoea agglomerans]